MSLFLLVEIALREIVAHKFRSALSMLGIVLGVSSLIATMALTAGIEIGTRAFMQQIGGLEYVQVTNKEISEKLADFWNLSPGRTLMDAEIIKASVPMISHVSPEMIQGATVSAGANSDRFRVVGVWPDNFVVARHELAAGRFISDLDVERATRAVVIGNAIAERLFPGRAPESLVGETILINSSPFQIVGVLTLYERESDERRKKIAEVRRKGAKFVGRQRGWDPFRGKNESILIPLSTLFYEFKAGQFPMDALESVRLDNLTLRVKNLDYFRETLEQARAALGITHQGVDDFDFETREEWFDRMEASISATRTSGGLIAAISLVVGGIGIANIMLASITERVREIGIRMAVGARSKDIFLQILVESVSVAMIGGIVGIAAGAILIQGLMMLAPSDNLPIIEPSAILLSVNFAILAGIAAGIYPALKASRLEPITALRYE